MTLPIILDDIENYTNKIIKDIFDVRKKLIDGKVPTKLVDKLLGKISMIFLGDLYDLSIYLEEEKNDYLVL